MEKLQNEAARIVTGGSKLVSITDLNIKESGWESLNDKKYKHKRVLLFKTVKGLVQAYLNVLVPMSVGSSSSYSLRDSHNLQNIVSRTNL